MKKIIMSTFVALFLVATITIANAQERFSYDYQSYDPSVQDVTVYTEDVLANGGSLPARGMDAVHVKSQCRGNTCGYGCRKIAYYKQICDQWKSDCRQHPCAWQCQPRYQEACHRARMRGDSNAFPPDQRVDPLNVSGGYEHEDRDDEDDEDDKDDENDEERNGGGLACWDLNGDGKQDENEDLNGDGVWDALDCRGERGEQGDRGYRGASGLACWDLNGDGEEDPDEDLNGDGVWDALDCHGQAGQIQLVFDYRQSVFFPETTDPEFGEDASEYLHKTTIGASVLWWFKSGYAFRGGLRLGMVYNDEWSTSSRLNKTFVLEGIAGMIFRVRYKPERQTLRAVELETGFNPGILLHDMDYLGYSIMGYVQANVHVVGALYASMGLSAGGVYQVEYLHLIERIQSWRPGVEVFFSFDFIRLFDAPPPRR